MVETERLLSAGGSSVDHPSHPSRDGAVCPFTVYLSHFRRTAGSLAGRELAIVPEEPHPREHQPDRIGWFTSFLLPFRSTPFSGDLSKSADACKQYNVKPFSSVREEFDVIYVNYTTAVGSVLRLGELGSPGTLTVLGEHSNVNIQPSA